MSDGRLERARESRWRREHFVELEVTQPRREVLVSVHPAGTGLHQPVRRGRVVRGIVLQVIGDGLEELPKLSVFDKE